MRRLSPLRSAIMILVLASGMLALQQSALSESGANILVANCTAPPLGGGQPNAPGTWAIHPRLGISSPPTFTEHDARDYVNRAGPWNRAYNAPAPTISDVQFISARAACGEIGERIDRPDDALVCLVTLRGDFALEGPPGFSRGGKTEYLVFDATSGNLIGIALLSR